VAAGSVEKAYSDQLYHERMISMFGLFGGSTKDENREKLDRLYRELSGLEQDKDNLEIEVENAKDNITYHERQLEKVKDKLDDLHRKWARFHDEKNMTTVREIDHLIRMEEERRKNEEQSIDRWKGKLDQAARKLRQIKREISQVKKEIDDLKGSW
jgi:predicted  nucleic acid-binding Zn-ribbon protein